ncbi:Seryl-tRNA synthetase [Psidium guajava]|nr:Seryl-tRNA synthetase [Psidium guajava]
MPDDAKFQACCLLLIFLTTSALSTILCSGARHVKASVRGKDTVHTRKMKTTTTTTPATATTQVGDEFLAAEERKVPSSPDPLHN